MTGTGAPRARPNRARIPRHDASAGVSSGGGTDMRQVQDGYRGLSLFVGLNIDRFLSAAAIGGAILGAAWLQSL